MAKRSEPSVKFKEFAGLNNMAEPRALGAGELSRADNIDLDDRNRIRRRRGHDQDYPASVGITACWSSNDETRMFMIDGGILQEYLGDGAVRELATGFSSDEGYFVDAGDRFFLSCGDKLGFINEDGYQDLLIPDPVTPEVAVTGGALPAGRYLVAVVLETQDGRQGSASLLVSTVLDTDQGLQITLPDYPGYTIRLYVSRANDDHLRFAGKFDGGGLALMTADWQLKGEVLDDVQINASSPPISGGPIAYFQGRLYLPLIDPNSGITYIYRSEPFWPHLFTPWQDAETIHGQLRMLVDGGEAVLVGTDRSIFALNDSGLVTLADYGVVSGQTHYIDRKSDKVYFWSREGICEGLPFKNLMEGRVSVPPGDRCYVGLVREGGFDRLLAGVHIDAENTAPNPR